MFLVATTALLSGCPPTTAPIDTTFDPALPPVAIRGENLTVNVSTGPVWTVAVRNLRPVTYEGTLSVVFPDGWKVTEAKQAVTVEPHKTVQVSFAIEKAADLDANRYPFEITAVGGGHTVTRKQTISVASMPFFKPVIDGNLAEWKDSIPITMTTGGKTTVVRGYWNLDNFCLAVEVQEDALTPRADASTPRDTLTACDAVQFALASRKVVTGDKPDSPVGRYEFLVTPTAKGPQCTLLTAPGAKLGSPPAPKPVPGAKVVIKRAGDVTRYELSIPVKLMPTVRPDVGREFRFSLLVHDAGLPLRDLGSAMNLTDADRKQYGWTMWSGASFGGTTPYDSMIEWGFCSSIH